jgi:hypothetical protein
MKSYKVLLIAFMSLWFINLNGQIGQIYLGGSTAFNISTYKTPPPMTYDYHFSFTPTVGKFLSEKLAIGIDLNFSHHGNKSHDNNNIETIIKSTGAGISPFLRYYPIKWNKFAVYCQGNIGISLAKSNAKTESTTSTGKNTSMNLNIYPGLSYDINDKISLQTSINILSLNYYYIINQQGSVKYESSILNFGAGLDNIFSTGVITIGAIFKL